MIRSFLLEVFMKKLVIIVMLFIVSLMSISCQTQRERYERIDFILPEVEYGYITYTEYNLTKNFEHITFRTEVEKIIGKKFNNTLSPYHAEITENYIYYLAEYKKRNRDIFNRHPENNQHIFDIALFRTNIYSMETELLYRFNAVYPTYLYRYSEQNTYFKIKDDQYLLFHYNGKIELFDIQLKEVIYEEEIYDDEKAYVNSENYPYRVNEYGDFYGIIDDTLFFYHYTGTAFHLMEFPALESAYLERFGDYLILSEHGSSNVNTFAYNIEQSAAVDIETALDYMESIEDSPEQPDYDFILNEKAYEYSEFYGEMTISQIDSEFEVVITYETMMEQNAAFKAISESWNSHALTRFDPISILIEDERLFIIFMNTEFGGKKPAFIFEYDLETQTSYYVGYHYGDHSLIPQKIIILDD